MIYRSLYLNLTSCISLLICSEDNNSDGFWGMVPPGRIVSLLINVFKSRDDNGIAVDR